jgi:predicted DNA-binding transcriptional regulator AlpA
MRKTEFLSSWKEIARYVGRDVRTIQRWERDREFPIHRPAGKLRSSVVALIPEIEGWMKKKNLAPPPKWEVS